MNFRAVFLIIFETVLNLQCTWWMLQECCHVMLSFHQVELQHNKNIRIYTVYIQLNLLIMSFMNVLLWYIVAFSYIHNNKCALVWRAELFINLRYTAYLKKWIMVKLNYLLSQIFPSFYSCSSVRQIEKIQLWTLYSQNRSGVTQQK